MPKNPTGDAPTDLRALVAIDLGAESCRVSLLRWRNGNPEIQLLHRIPNGPIQVGENLHWPLDRILQGVEDGLRKAADAAPEGIRSVAVDGWAVDYVRLNPDGAPIHPPFCYRDERTVPSKAAADALIPPKDLFAQTGAQPLRINTIYQLLADKVPQYTPWLLLPEYILHWLGGQRAAEYTNATHTGLVDLATGDWSPAIFQRLGLSLPAAPPIVPPGASLGKLRGPLATLPAFANTELIAPACHDTASAIAAIDLDLAEVAYIVSGTWSLVGTLILTPINTPCALESGFTNQGEASGGYCFHTNVNGMWLLKQCIDSWSSVGRLIDLPSLIAQAENMADLPGIIDVDAPPLMLAGQMPARINAQLESQGLAPIPDFEGNEPIFARLLFQSLAHRYAQVLRDLESLTGRNFRRITVLGGASRNALLARLTEQSTGLPVSAGHAEGSTIGNFAVQLAASSHQPPAPEAVRAWAARLTQASSKHP